MHILACARSWIGTRYQHLGRRKRTSDSLGAVDCGGLILGVGHELGFLDTFIDDYSKFPNEEWVKAMCSDFLDPLLFSEMLPGDILLLKWGRSAAHLGILGCYQGNYTLIHAHAQSRSVVEQRLEEEWKERIVGSYRYRTHLYDVSV